MGTEWESMWKQCERNEKVIGNKWEINVKVMWK